MIPHLHSTFSARAEAIDKAATTASDFAVLVWGIPPDASKDIIRTHFDLFKTPSPEPARDVETEDGRDKQGHDESVVSSPPKICATLATGTAVSGDKVAEAVDTEKGNMDGVAEVFLARRDRRVLEELRQLAALQDAVDDLRYALAKNPPPAAAARAEAKVAKLQRRLKDREAAIQAVQHGSKRAAVCAFVVFRSEAARDACLQEYTGPGSRVYTWECWGQRMDLRLGGRHRLKVVRAVEPSDVLWENLECSW